MDTKQIQVMAAEIYAARKAYREVPASDWWRTGSKIEGAGSRTHAQRPSFKFASPRRFGNRPGGCYGEARRSGPFLGRM